MDFLKDYLFGGDMNKLSALLITTVLFTPFTFVVDAEANDINQVSEIYMPNNSDGFLTLANEDCRIPGIKDAYPYKALNADDQGHEIEGCWQVTPYPEGSSPAAFSVFMYEEGSPNVGTFRQHLFSAEKKRWPDSGVESVKSTL